VPLGTENRLLAINKEVALFAGRENHAPLLEAAFAQQFDEAS
jgi:hypothetical protein